MWDSLPLQLSLSCCYVQLHSHTHILLTSHIPILASHILSLARILHQSAVLPVDRITRDLSTERPRQRPIQSFLSDPRSSIDSPSYVQVSAMFSAMLIPFTGRAHEKPLCCGIRLPLNRDKVFVTKAITGENSRRRFVGLGKHVVSCLNLLYVDGRDWHTMQNCTRIIARCPDGYCQTHLK